MNMNMDTLKIQSAVLHESVDEGIPSQIEVTLLSGDRIFVPLDPANRHYAEIMRQVDAGEITIEPADENV